MQQQRHLSAYPALLEPTCRRRLPMPPDSHLRRSSSPRILPTPPPLSPEHRCPSAAPHLERRSSGRQLPRPPTAELNHFTNIVQAHNHNHSQSSLSPVSLTPDPTPDDPEEFDEDDVEEDVEEEEEEVEDDDEDVEEEIAKPVVITPPEEFRRISPEIHIAPPPPQPRRMSKFSVHSPSIEQVSFSFSFFVFSPTTLFFA
uniref:Uncharacterized protein n=1 Tax=Caenorhabditis japonica TaxID=281687 RepID=A0A8R1I1P3_CAEJA